MITLQKKKEKNATASWQFATRQDGRRLAVRKIASPRGQNPAPEEHRLALPSSRCGYCLNTRSGVHRESQEALDRVVIVGGVHGIFRNLIGSANSCGNFSSIVT